MHHTVQSFSAIFHPIKQGLVLIDNNYHCFNTALTLLIGRLETDPGLSGKWPLSTVCEHLAYKKL